ncbi:MAG TPA: radical SAM protein [Anaerolineae bacterium]|nr:radical SAM protein [Anaerolineae bacterium]HQH37021.1 radical SAM protein [Anaerolineae bacterium]
MVDRVPAALYIHPAKQAVDLYDTPARHRFGRPYGLIPMGVPALLNLLCDNGIPVAGINFPLEKKLDSGFDLRKWLHDRREARMVLIDLHWYEHSYGAINVAQVVKQVIPDAWVILGGLTSSAFAGEIIKDIPVVDFVVRGDAERPLLALAQTLMQVERGVMPDLSTVPNLTYRLRGQVMENPRTYCARPEDFTDFNFVDLEWLEHQDEYFVHEYLVVDMDLARQAQEGADISRYRGRWITTARGCDFECSYCGGAKSAHKAIAGREGVVPVPVETIVNEIKHLIEHQVIQVCFSYDLAALGESYWRPLFRTLRKEQIKIGLYNEFFQLPPPGFIKEFVRAADMQHSSVALNPYSGSERVRRLNGKRYNDAQLMNALDEVNLYNVPIIVYFSLNLPGEDAEAAQESIQLAQSIYDMYPHSKLKILNSCHTVEPMSPMEQRAGRYGVNVQWHTFKDWYEYCRNTQLQLPGARTGEWRGFDLLPPAKRSVEAMADAWDAAAKGHEATWWPIPPSW